MFLNTGLVIGVRGLRAVKKSSFKMSRTIFCFRLLIFEDVASGEEVLLEEGVVTRCEDQTGCCCACICC